MTSWLIGHYAELIAAVLGLAGVWLTTRQNIWCWPVGLANVMLSAWVFFHEKLYADTLLQVFYLVLTVYGWYHWLFGGKQHSGLPVRRIRRKELFWAIAAGLTGSLLMGWLFSEFTDAAFPYWDSQLTVWGIIATWAMARKILEHWIMWIVIDLNCTLLYYIKEMYAFAPQYFIFTLLAAYGLYRWHSDLKKQENS